MSLTTLCNLDETSPGWVNSTLADKHRMYLSSLITTFYFMYLEGDGQARRLRLYWQDVLQAQRYFATHGQSGQLPQGMDPRDSALPGVLMQRLFNNKTLPAWQADMQQRYSAVGLRVVFPSVP